MFKANEKLLFIGDSITQDGRFDDEEGLGKGYVRLIHDFLEEHQTIEKPIIVNKGISGNRVTDLEKRWEEDVIREQPDWLSVSIGVNDVWRQLDSPDMVQVLPDHFAEVYRSLLQDVKEKTNAKLIIMEPTIIEEDVASKGNKMLHEYVEITHRLAQDFNGILVPTHEAFLNHLKQPSAPALTTDGVHMNDQGRKLMTDTWLKAVGIR